MEGKMEFKDIELKLKLKVKDIEIELTREEARELIKKVKDIVDWKTEKEYIPYYPHWYYEPRSYWVPYDGGNWTCDSNKDIQISYAYN